MVFDVAIIGAGMAGASLAAALAPQMRVGLFEAEDQPGYHATGRSAAFWSETYGGPLVQPLTTASGAFLRQPPVDFAQSGFLGPRGALMIGTRDAQPALASFIKGFAGSGVSLEVWDARQLRDLIPGLLPSWDRGVWEPGNQDIDVARLHQAYLAAARKSGAVLHKRARVTHLARDRGGWTLGAGTERIRAARVVNAAGAWASDIARLASASPISIQPLRRTIVQLRLQREIPAHLPLTIDLNGQFYFKPEGPNRIWLSPHDETPSPAMDAAPDEVDIARAIDRLQHLVDWPIAAVERSWAGLRSFAPDRAPVFGEDAAQPGFYWCAGQGGFGIQTAPAIAALLAAEILGVPPAGPYADVDASLYSPHRFGL